MADLFFFLAILFQCGIFPMAVGDCYDQPSVTVVTTPLTVRSEEVQGP